MFRLLLFLSLPLYVIDQLTKGWIVRTFVLNVDERVVVPDFFTLHHVANTGIAFGQFNGGEHSNYIFGGIAIAALALITGFIAKGRFPARSAGSRSPFSSPECAAISRTVCGTDMWWIFSGSICTFPGPTPWPSFNVADSCVVSAAILLAIASFTEAPKPKPKPETKPETK